MATINLRPELIKRLEDAAAEQSVMLEDLLESAIQTYLRSMEREKIKAKAQAFRSMHAELTKKYLGQYVAIHNARVVDHDENFESLHSRIRQRFGRQPVLLRRVEAEPQRTLLFRSPRLERG